MHLKIFPIFSKMNLLWKMIIIYFHFLFHLITTNLNLVLIKNHNFSSQIIKKQIKNF